MLFSAARAPTTQWTWAQVGFLVWASTFTLSFLCVYGVRGLVEMNNTHVPPRLCSYFHSAALSLTPFLEDVLKHTEAHMCLIVTGEGCFDGCFIFIWPGFAVLRCRALEWSVSHTHTCKYLRSLVFEVYPADSHCSDQECVETTFSLSKTTSHITKKGCSHSIY